jgi:hypothetical protein
VHSPIIEVAVAVSSLIGVLPIHGKEVGFYVSGTVLNVFQDPFQAGITVAPLTNVSGRVLFDSDSRATDPIATCDCMGYRQHIAGGFTALFGNNTVRADDYVVQIKNDISQPWGLVDTITVRFSGGFSPPLSSPLIVNGNPYPESWFQVNVDGPSYTFQDSSIPQPLDLSGFISPYNFLDEITTDLPIGVVFGNSSLSAFTTQIGDYDGDGWIDPPDYERWRETFSSTSILDADGNRDGIVDSADYVIWRKSTSFVRTETVVPEPATLPAFTGGFLTLWAMAGKIQRSRLNGGIFR